MGRISAKRLAGGSDLQRGHIAPRSTIRVPKAAEIVADQIRRRIIRGELKENDFLPHEDQLMATLGISRPTLREAFRILEAEKLISVVRGSRTGARVHLPRVESVSRYAGFVLQSRKTTIADIYNARLAIEPFVVRRLASNPSREACDKLREEVARLTALVDEERYAEFMAGLADIHWLLVKLGGNQTLLLIATLLQDIVARHQVEFLAKRTLAPDVRRKRALWGPRSFSKLIQLIEAGDADRAEAHWRLHLANSNKAWVETMEPGQPIVVLD